MKKYKPLARPAVLTAFIGYLMVIVGLIIDIGKPLAFWHPLGMWQHHSIMFEVVLCIALYTTVLGLECAPPLLDAIGIKGLANLMRKRVILFPLVIAGITLSYLHQSSLGAFFLIMPAKLHKLWYTPIIPQLFFLSAIAVGLAIISFESMVSTRVFKRGYETEILQGLAKGTSLVLLVYLIVRLTDLAARGNLHLIQEESSARLLFLVEIVVGVVLPMVLLYASSRKGSVSTIFVGQVLVMLGVVLNRFNANFLAQAPHGGSYFPSWMEIAITFGVISFGVFLYRLAVLRLEIFPYAEVEH
jgi:Ni/Fe-hydrogenase subunit HybB-like protein